MHTGETLLQQNWGRDHEIKRDQERDRKIDKRTDGRTSTNIRVVVMQIGWLTVPGTSTTGGIYSSDDEMVRLSGPSSEERSF